MKKNRMRICGRKTITAPTPPSTPSTSMERSAPAGMAPDSATCAPETSPASHAIGASAPANTAWNMKNSSAASSSGPATGCSVMPSRRCDQRRCAPCASVTALAIVRASRCNRVISLSGDSRDRRRFAAQQRRQPGAELGQPAPPHRHRRDDRQAEDGRQPFGIDAGAVTFGQIDHVERHQHRQAEPAQFENEAQMVAQIGGIDDRDDRIEALFTRQHAQHGIAGDGFVGRSRRQAVGAGQVDQFGSAAIGQRQAPGLAFDGDARIIADLLAAAGQRVEQAGLAGIGIADQRDDRVGDGAFRFKRGVDFDQPRHRSAQRHHHVADAHRQRIAAEGRTVQQLDIDAFVKAQFVQPLRGFGGSMPARSIAVIVAICPRDRRSIRRGLDMVDGALSRCCCEWLS